MSGQSRVRAALCALAVSVVLAAAPGRALDPAGSPAPGSPAPGSNAPGSPAAALPSLAPTEAQAAPPAAASPAEPPSPAPAPAAAPRSWLAQGSGSDPSAPEASSGSNAGLTIAAVLVLLCLAAAAIVLRYKRQKLSPLGPSESRLTVLSSSRVGPKALAVTAHINGRVLLLGVTDHTVTHLGWLDARDAEPVSEGARPERAPEPDDDDLPDDYPGSALRASRVPPAFASSSNLRRFQEVLRGAEESRAELPLRPSYHPTPLDAASLLAAQTTDVVAGAPTKAKAAPVSIRRKRRGRESVPPRQERPAAAAPSSKPADPSLEGQVAGLRALRNGG